MGAKTEALARQFEEKARAAVTTLEKLGDAEWKRVTAAEKWTVGVTAHHLAGALEVVAGIVTGIVSGGPSRGNFTRAMLDEMNAQHAKEHAHCTREETLALFQRGAGKAFAVVQGLSDDQLAKSGTVFTDAPPMTAEQLTCSVWSATSTTTWGAFGRPSACDANRPRWRRVLSRA